MQPERPHVALIIETSNAYGRELLAGVTRYLQTHRPWSVFLEQRELWTPPPMWLGRWHGGGVICRKTTPELARMLRSARIPLVDLNDRSEVPGLPRIESDHRGIGALAAEHLLERGFRHLAFCGFTGQAWSVKRRVGFVGRVEAEGRECRVWESPWHGRHAHPWEQEQSEIRRWLKSMPKPVGVMACNDWRGQHVLEGCARAGLAVPEEVAVVGVDDEQVLCNLCQPPLSSVIPNAERVGYEAAALLDRVMAGQKAPREALLVEPIGIAVRQSSDVLAVDDPDLASVLRFIRERACHGCSMKDVMRHASVSRSVLERRFRRFLKRSPQAEIRHVQLNRVRELLSKTDLSLSRVAELAGFEHPEYMSVVFKRETGRTPGEFRAASIGNGGPAGKGSRRG